MSAEAATLPSHIREAVGDCPVLAGKAEGDLAAAKKAAGRFSAACLSWISGRTDEEKVAWLKVSVEVSRMVFQPWMMEVLFVLGTLGRARFNEMQELMGMSSRTLSNKLQELRKAGLIDREVFDEHPVRIEYFLTATGEETASLASPLVAHLNVSLLRQAGRT